ncbi:hypothetical protein A3A71_03330 [Candidatus Berkelbacteria bacterium RIFCSPLOWO2_01_FULL_50_28]|uniref:Uncharacterized protein n=1 Tax=Candidatus Berkelbacteria bacterium RIFCSPLOWO2_01_FULL_50_28 TaxID=1797471 RepID=A0A1F5ECL4_9BACT|nr:MAG: hypothetical protein A2807_02895 [Candidatus Berkelbacteria bacterium RIFCSPHIGHO2_01_FULL_50_36]OGD65093.1 MAG: hypothetical protein A3A71_03330 [Candidatus Berkelbacteria bacterium RIFCSPLOWO2_01_FULL_50_28]
MSELLLEPSGRQIGIEAEAETRMRLPPITSASQRLTRQIPNNNEPGPDQPVDGLADVGYDPSSEMTSSRWSERPSWNSRVLTTWQAVIYRGLFSPRTRWLIVDLETPASAARREVPRKL